MTDILIIISDISHEKVCHYGTIFNSLCSIYYALLNKHKYYRYLHSPKDRIQQNAQYLGVKDRITVNTDSVWSVLLLIGKVFLLYLLLL